MDSNRIHDKGMENSSWMEKSWMSGIIYWMSGGISSTLLFCIMMMLWRKEEWFNISEWKTISLTTSQNMMRIYQRSVNDNRQLDLFFVLSRKDIQRSSCYFVWLCQFTSSFPFWSFPHSWAKNNIVVYVDANSVLHWPCYPSFQSLSSLSSWFVQYFLFCWNHFAEDSAASSKPARPHIKSWHWDHPTKWLDWTRFPPGKKTQANKSNLPCKREYFRQVAKNVAKLYTHPFSLDYDCHPIMPGVWGTTYPYQPLRCQLPTLTGNWIWTLVPRWEKGSDSTILS